MPDVTPLAAILAAALAGVLAVWAPIIAAIAAGMVAKVAAATGRRLTAAELAADPAELAVELHRVMVQVAGAAAGQVVAEAADQGVTVEPAHPSPGDMHQHAHDASQRVVDHMAQVAATAAADAAAGDTADELAAVVQTALDEIGDAGQHQAAGNAMHGAMTTARLDTYRQGPLGAIYSSEVNDSHTCEPCHEIDGKWLGNTDQMAQVEMFYPGGAYGGYIGCLGFSNCRGTITGVWRPGTEPTPVEPGPKGHSLQGSIDSGIASEQPLGGGETARTDLVTFNDGTQAVRKTGKKYLGVSPADMANAEELSSLLAARVGITAPEVVRESRDTVYMTYIDAPAAADRGGAAMGIIDKPAGRRLGLFDATIANFDRNSGNYLLPSADELVAIDHGSAWADADASLQTMSYLTRGNYFIRPLIEVAEDGSVTGSFNYSRADIEHLRQALAGMEGEFTRLRRHQWYEYALARLAFLEQHARGEGSVF